MKDLVLYMKPTCPYCQKVLRFMDKHNIELAQRDISADSEARDELERVGGQVMVPCLFIDGKPMYESSDIIEYLKAEFVDK